jgi:hypothetical protein
MKSVADQILTEVISSPGVTDKWLAERIFGKGAPQQRVNGECRRLADAGKLVRRQRADGLIGNFIGGDGSSAVRNLSPANDPDVMASIFTEDAVKRHLETWLIQSGWLVQIAWARSRGVDIAATREGEKWLIEVKGEGSLNAMRVNYFLAMLGELLQRMDDESAKHSIALPDLKQFRNLWSRLPGLAKRRTGITALFVRPDGFVEEIE